MATITIPDDTYALLVARAEREGRTVEDVVVPLIENGTEAVRRKPGIDLAAFEKGMAAFDALVEEFGKHLPPGHHVDDSREAIYFNQGNHGESLPRPPLAPLSRPVLTGEEWERAFAELNAQIEARADQYPPGFQVDASREAMYAEREDACR